MNRLPTLVLLATGLSLGLFLYGAGRIPLSDPDEGRYAEISREMAESGDWLTPTLFGIPYLEKPPLLYWSTTIAFGLLGVNELAARLTPALAAALGIFAVGAFAERHFTLQSGWLSSLALTSSGLYFVLARALVTDMLFTVLVASALLSFLSARERRIDEGFGALLFWLFLAAATMTKGPAAIVISGAVIFVDAVLGRSWRSLFRPRLLLTAPLLLGLALPWFASIQAKYPDFLSFYLWKEHLNRAAGSEHAEPFYWFLPLLAAGLFPWTPLAVAALPGWLRTAREDSTEGRIVRFLLVWAAVVFVIFSLAAGKLATYILPMFPPLSILLGRFLDRRLADEARGKSIERALLASGAVFLLGLGALSVVPFVVEVPLGAASASFVAVPLLAGGAAVIAWRRSPGPKPFAAIVLATLALYVGLATLAPSLAESFTARPLIRRLEQELTTADDFVLWGAYYPSAAFYLRRSPYLVGVRPELRLGKELLGEIPNIVVDLSSLRSRTSGRRLFCLTDNKKKREGELRASLGDISLVAKNYVGALWLRSPSAAPSASPAHTLTQGRNR